MREESMFFYASLFVASFIVAMIVLWLYKSLANIGKAIYQAILPSSKSNFTEHAKDTVTRLTVNNTPTPWGWGGNAKPANVARTNAASTGNQPSNAQAIPWGWRGNKHKIPEYRVKGGIPILPVSGTRPRVQPKARSQAQSQASNNRVEKIGWPYREEQFEFAGDTYKVTQKVKLRKTNLRKSAKPWGW